MNRERKKQEDHEFGARIGRMFRNARLDARMTQAELARACNTSQSAISELETSAGCTIWLLRRVAQHMGFRLKIVIEKKYETF